MNRKAFEEKFDKSSDKLDFSRMDKIIKKSLRPLPENTDGTKNLVIVIEEFMEIAQEISKYLRGESDKIGIIEELADAYLSIKYIQKICDISDKQLQKAINVKLDRQNERNEE